MARRSPRISLVLKQTKTLGGRVAKDPVKRESTARNAIIKSEEVDDGQSPQRLIEPEFVHFPASAMPNLEAATKHLCSVDPRFGPLFDRFTPKPWTQEGLLKPKNHFRSLVLGVLSQQVSGAAARSIGKRFVALFMQYPNAPNVDMDPEVEDVASIIPNIKVEAVDQPRLSTASITHDAAPANAEDMDAFPAPEDVAQREVLYLKSAGLSLRKAEYVKGIAEAFLSGHLNEEFFATANDEEIKKRLISIRGLGPWSAEMFMMFSLNRWDVISPGDIGIQRGMSYWIGKDPKDKSKHNKNKASKYMTEAEMLSATEAWQPYRSIGCWAMWRVDGAIDPVSQHIKSENELSDIVA